MNTFPDIELILVMHPDHLIAAREAMARCGPYHATLVPGGATRSASVQRGLKLVEEDSIVFVHDGVRCLPTTDLIRTCYAVAVEKGNAVPAVAPADSVRLIIAGGTEAIDRQTVRLIQTPQTFHAGILKRAYAKVQGEEFTDDATVAEQAGTRIELVEGENTNIKITRPADLLIASAILASRRADTSSPENPAT